MCRFAFPHIELCVLEQNRFWLRTFYTCIVLSADKLSLNLDLSLFLVHSQKPKYGFDFNLAFVDNDFRLNIWLPRIVTIKMSIARAKLLLQGPTSLLQQFKTNSSNQKKFYQIVKRSVTTTPSGSLRPEPPKTPFGFLGIICAVIPGLLIGATISKNMANFLEENELFVPSDDDDDDD